MTASVRIGDRSVGRGEPCYVIAEAGVNHDGDLSVARELVRAAHDAGADAVKFQLYRAGDLASAGAPKAAYQRRTTDSDEPQEAMLARLELPDDAFADLARECAEQGIDFLCTAYSEEGIDLLARLGVPAFKIASATLVEPSLLARAAATGRPLLLSTGMATIDEIDEAMRAVHGAPVVLLQCTTEYPSRLEDANLAAMSTLAERYDVPVGYSDHTEGKVAALAAISLGAVVLEKHLTLDRTRSGPDHEASMKPAELARLVAEIREVEQAVGSATKAPTERELENAYAMRRSIFAVADIAAGSRIEADQIGLRRPAAGLPPRDAERIVGARAATDIPAGTPIGEEHLSR